MTRDRDWRSILPPAWRYRLMRLREEVFSFFSSGSLTELAIIYRTDKWGAHAYTPIYERWFQPLRYKPVRLLEIGVGGYAKKHFGAKSLRMWKSFFPNGKITGIDIEDKTKFAEHRIKIYTGDQADASFLRQVHALEGPFDIIIDDGSHRQSDVLASFSVLFPLLAPGGLYIIEDTQTAYWPAYEGSTAQMDSIPSSMNFFSAMIHDVNQTEWRPGEIPESHQHPFDLASIAFYHNLIIAEKRKGTKVTTN